MTNNREAQETAAERAMRTLEGDGELAMLDFLADNHCHDGHPNAWDQAGICIMYDLSVVTDGGDHYTFRWRNGSMRFMENRPANLPEQGRRLWLTGNIFTNLAWSNIMERAARLAAQAIRPLGEELKIDDLELINTPDEPALSPTECARHAPLLRQNVENAADNVDRYRQPPYDTAHEIADIALKALPNDQWLELVRATARQMTSQASHGEHAEEAAQRVKPE